MVRQIALDSQACSRSALRFYVRTPSGSALQKRAVPRERQRVRYYAADSRSHVYGYLAVLAVIVALVLNRVVDATV